MVGLVVICGVFKQKYVSPVWFGKSKEEEQLEQLNQGLRDLQTTLTETLKGLRETQAALQQQHQELVRSDDTRKVGRTLRVERLTIMVCVVIACSGLRDRKEQIFERI